MTLKKQFIESRKDQLIYTLLIRYHRNLSCTLNILVWPFQNIQEEQAKLL